MDWVEKPRTRGESRSHRPSNKLIRSFHSANAASAVTVTPATPRTQAFHAAATGRPSNKLIRSFHSANATSAVTVTPVTTTPRNQAFHAAAAGPVAAKPTIQGDRNSPAPRLTFKTSINRLTMISFATDCGNAIVAGAAPTEIMIVKKLVITSPRVRIIAPKNTSEAMMNTSPRTEYRWSRGPSASRLTMATAAPVANRSPANVRGAVPGPNANPFIP